MVMNSKRMTATTHYSNGGLNWPEGMSANWPAGETRIIPDNLYAAIMRDGAGKFDVEHYQPAPEATLPDFPAPMPVEVNAPEPAASVEGAPPKNKGGRPRKTAATENKD